MPCYTHRAIAGLDPTFHDDARVGAPAAFKGE